MENLRRSLVSRNQPTLIEKIMLESGAPLGEGLGFRRVV